MWDTIRLVVDAIYIGFGALVVLGGAILCMKFYAALAVVTYDDIRIWRGKHQGKRMTARRSWARAFLEEDR